MKDKGLDEKISVVYSYLKSLKERTAELNKVSFSVHEGPEIVIAAQPFDLVLKQVVQYMAKSKAFVNGSNPNIGDFRRSYGIKYRRWHY